MPRSREKRQAELDAQFTRADSQYEKGNYRSAFRLCLAPAKRGDERSQKTLGFFYKNGIGVKRNHDLALYWSRRAYRQGSWAAAHNVGLMFCDEQNFKQALAWFKRAAELNDADACLEIAKIYLAKNDTAKAIPYLYDTINADPIFVLQESREEARKLLRELTTRKSHPKRSKGIKEGQR